jgi:hypothetical protein
MRLFFIVFLALVFFSPAPSALASCVLDEHGGSWYDNQTNQPCTPLAVTNSQNQPAINSPSSNTTLINPLNTGECSPNENCLMNFLNKILEFVIKIGTVVVTLMTVYVGYLFVVARGAPEKIKDARNALMWTVIGALILLGSQAIAIAIKATVQAVSVGQ